MAQQPYLTSHSYNSSLKASCQSLKIKTHVEAYILRHVCRIVRALSSAKSFLLELLSLTTSTTNKNSSNYITKMNKRKKIKRVLKSITMWCNWPSSHVIPMPELAASFRGHNAISQTYYDSTWNSIVIVDDNDDGLERQLSGYLQWLEENELGGNHGDDTIEIDRLAEKFIASCHEKFRLEKQESYRRYQEMLARSM
ncbi:uncharacterized protein LOC110107142 [Dendrobium catenatum]|uniref:DUF761 domain-containing protein n=1 Tax=Dendrobium catenatum TaxID=906689 RepID=A0A2I0VSR0_9ASPA|nr:uncharacterized protein LOC110107142 [Dendrobium catenatum]PKU66446.1 hypothetical protein MA16_Dca018148 [Dendrobium catenatum]